MARRGRKHVEAENGERWLLTYADLITLLLVFFVVMYSISQADSAKFQRFSTSVQQAFNVDVLRGTPPGTAGPLTLEQDPRFVSYLTIRSQVISLMDRMQLGAQNADVELTREGIVIHVSDTVLFPPGQAQLRPDATRVLDGLVQIFGPLPNAVRVEGHTDDTPPSGPYPDNWELSVLRAVSAVRYLTDVGGIEPQRLSALGYGEYRPRASNDTIEGRRKNRRVDFVIVQPGLPE